MQPKIKDTLFVDDLVELVDGRQIKLEIPNKPYNINGCEIDAELPEYKEAYFSTKFSISKKKMREIYQKIFKTETNNWRKMHGLPKVRRINVRKTSN